MTAHSCPCGQMHELGNAVTSLIEAYGERVIVTTSRGSWLVPRTYIAAHGIKGAELASLAGHYQWERISGE